MISLLETCLSNVIVAGGLAAFAWLASRFSRNPHLVRGLWLLVLLKLVSPPVLAFSWPTIPDVPPTAQSAVLDSDARWTELGELPLPLPWDLDQEEPSPLRPQPGQFGWIEAVLAVWFTCAVFLLCLALFRLRRFQQLVAETEFAPAWCQDEACRLANDLGLAKTPQVRWVEGRMSPLLWTWGGSHAILLPRGLVQQLGAEGTRAVLAHELMHLRRGDHWVRRFEMLVLTVYWWLPLAWWARRQLRAAEEQCCDGAVVGQWPERAGAYAHALWQTVNYVVESRAAPLLASGFGYGASLRRRFVMLTRYDVPKRMSRGTLLLLALAGLLVLPVMAQGPAKEPPARQELPETKAPDPFAQPALTGVTVGLTRAETVEDRVGRLEQMMGEILQAVKQQPASRTQGRASQPVSVASTSRIPTASAVSAELAFVSEPTIGAAARLEGNDLAMALDGMRGQLEARRAEVKRLNTEIKRLQAMIAALETSDPQTDAGNPFGPTTDPMTK